MLWTCLKIYPGPPLFKKANKEGHFAGFKVKKILKALFLRYCVSHMVLRNLSPKSYTHTARRYRKNTEKLTEKKLLHKLCKITRMIRIKNWRKRSFWKSHTYVATGQLFPKFDLGNFEICDINFVINCTCMTASVWDVHFQCVQIPH